MSLVINDFSNVFFFILIGKPKGVMLSHENIVACVSACVKQLGVDKHAPNKNDVMISYLPMAHMLERICQVRTKLYHVNQG